MRRVVWKYLLIVLSYKQVNVGRYVERELKHHRVKNTSVVGCCSMYKIMGTKMFVQNLDALEGRIMKCLLKKKRRRMFY